MGELMVGLTEYFAFYNSERPHQSLRNRTPDVVYRTSIGGGAVIVDKFGGLEENPSVPPRPAECSAVKEPGSEEIVKTKPNAKSGQRRPAASEVECTT